MSLSLSLQNYNRPFRDEQHVREETRKDARRILGRFLHWIITARLSIVEKY
jgi:hypothetical protein